MSRLRSILKTDDIVAYTLRKEAIMKYLLNDINEVSQEDLDSIDVISTPCTLNDDWNFCIGRTDNGIHVSIHISYIKSLTMIRPFLNKLDRVYDANLDKNISAYRKIVRTCSEVNANPNMVTPTVVVFEISGHTLNYATFHHNRTTERISILNNKITDLKCYYSININELSEYFD